MLKTLPALAIAALFSSLSWAQSLELQPDAPQHYVVKRGDTLWDISGMYLERPWLWPLLWEKNPEIENPHLIYPGDELVLAWQAGKPVLKKIVASDKQIPRAPIYGVPQALLEKYLMDDALVDEDILTRAPRVIGDQEGSRYISRYCPFFVEGALEIDDWYVYRIEKTFERGEDANRSLMYSLKKVGHAKRLGVSEELSQMMLTQQFQEVRPNDILLPAKGFQNGQVLSPKPAPVNIAGKMIGHLYGAKYVGMRQIVVIDRGEEDGLQAGHVASVLQPSIQMKGARGQLRYASNIDSPLAKVHANIPQKSIGHLLVIRPYQRFSLAMVVQASTPLAAPLSLTAVQ